MGKVEEECLLDWEGLGRESVGHGDTFGVVPYEAVGEWYACGVQFPFEHPRRPFAGIGGGSVEVYKFVDSVGAVYDSQSVVPPLGVRGSGQGSSRVCASALRRGRS